MTIEVFNFFRQLYRQDKKLLVLVVLYCCGIAYYCSLQREEFPFLLYGMYSLKEEPKDTYVIYTFEVDGIEEWYAGFLDPKKELIASPLQNGASKYRDGQLTNEQMRALTDWLHDLYFTPWESNPYKQRDIYQLTYTYNKEGLPQLLKKELLFRNVRQ